MKTEGKNKAITKAMFTKEQLCMSNTFADSRDILVAVLDEDMLYTAEDAQNKKDEFLKGGVN